MQQFESYDWRTLEVPEIALSYAGCTITKLEERLYIVGGCAGEAHTCTLSLLCYNLRSAVCVPVIVNNAVAASNRLYHASVGFDNCVYVFGGCLPSGDLTGEVLQLRVTEEGVLVEVCSAFMAPRKGHSVCVCASSEGIVAVVYGGLDIHGSATHDIHVFHFHHGTLVLKQNVAVVGVEHISRVYHSAAAIGPFAFVFGGTNGAEMLGDLLLLDTRGLFMIAEDTKGRRDKKAATTIDKDHDTQPVLGGIRCRYVRCTGVAPSPRCMHGCVLLDVQGSQMICVVGGIGRRELCAMNVYTCCVPSHIPSVAEVSWQESAFHTMPAARFGHTCIADLSRIGNAENEDQALYCVGGVTMRAEGPQRAHSSTVLLLSKCSMAEVVVEASNPLGWGRKEYSNGDVYEGSMSNGLRHGEGRQTFAEQSTYEV
jgi:hypothetical protein